MRRAKLVSGPKGAADGLARTKIALMFSCCSRDCVLRRCRCSDGEVPERSNGAVSKTVVPFAGDRGFESLPLRQPSGWATQRRPSLNASTGRGLPSDELRRPETVLTRGSQRPITEAGDPSGADEPTATRPPWRCGRMFTSPRLAVWRLRLHSPHVRLTRRARILPQSRRPERRVFAADRYSPIIARWSYRACSTRL